MDEFGQPSSYHAVLDATFVPVAQPRLDLAELVVEAAVQSGGAPSSARPQHSDEIRELIDARRMEEDTEKRKDNAKEGQRRGWVTLGVGTAQFSCRG